MRYRATTIFVLVLLASSTGCWADQTKIPNYAKAQKIAYGIYVGVPARDSADIYCGIRFKAEADKAGRPTNWLTLEHSYPADWMADQFDCAGRKECRATPDLSARKRFNHAEADLHNLWPAVDKLNFARGKKPYGEVADKEPREVALNGATFNCDFFASKEAIEPRDIAKGNLARSIFYMCREYRFPVEAKMLAVLKRWNEADPPTAAERLRNDRIEAIQGNRNPFVDRPSLVKNLRCQ